MPRFPVASKRKGDWISLVVDWSTVPSSFIPSDVEMDRSFPHRQFSTRLPCAKTRRGTTKKKIDAIVSLRPIGFRASRGRLTFFYSSTPSRRHKYFDCHKRKWRDPLTTGKNKAAFLWVIRESSASFQDADMRNRWASPFFFPLSLPHLLLITFPPPLLFVSFCCEAGNRINTSSASRWTTMNASRQW